MKSGKVFNAGFTGFEDLLSDDNDMWVENIIGLAEEVAESLGVPIVNFIYEKFGAKGVHDLSPAVYDQVFSELMFLSRER
ncbi:MAG: hypothetical protein SO157_04925 [Bullifex sp.]|nr:hypothetical protein [Bullifex sp.]